MKYGCLPPPVGRRTHSYQPSAGTRQRRCANDRANARERGHRLRPRVDHAGGAAGVRRPRRHQAPAGHARAPGRRRAASMPHDRHRVGRRDVVVGDQRAVGLVERRRTARSRSAALRVDGVPPAHAPTRYRPCPAVGSLPHGRRYGQARPARLRPAVDRAALPWTAPTAAGAGRGTTRAPARLQVDDRPRPRARARSSVGPSHAARPAARPGHRADGGRPAGAWARTCPQWTTSAGWSGPGRCAGPAHVDVGLAGTVMRFLPPLAGARRRPGHLRRRPARPQPPARARCSRRCARSASRIDAAPERRPAADRARRRPGRAAARSTIDASASSQLVSGLLLAAPTSTAASSCATSARRCRARRTCG